MTTAYGRVAWREVKICPVCERYGWCRVSPDGGAVACRRQDRGAVRRLDYTDGPAYLHRLDGRRFTPSAPLPPARPDAPRAVDADLDRVYAALLAGPELRLHHHHREHLLARGLSAADLDRDGYRTNPASCRASIVRRLRERFADDLLMTVPGIVAKEGQHGRYLTLAGMPGILIPVRSAAGHVVGLIVRPDEPGEQGKYRWLSSAFYNGPTPNARTHVPAGVGPSLSVTLVEGTLKANVAHALSRDHIIGLPGPFVTAEAITTLRTLGAREALLALDADVRTNRHVARAQLMGLHLLKQNSFESGIVRWDPALGKGLDDVLLNQRTGAV